MQELHLAFDLSIFIYGHYHVQVGKLKRELDCKDLANKIENQIMNIAMQFQESNIVKSIVLCADSRSFRNDIWMGYKMGRKSLPFDKQEVIQYLTLKVLQWDGLEADDLMYIYADKYPHTVMVTEDKDMLQAVKDETLMYKYKSGKLLAADDVDYKFEALKKVLYGCPSDSIPEAISARKLNNPTLALELKNMYSGQPIKIEQICLNLIEKGYPINLDMVGINYDLCVYNMDLYRRRITGFDDLYSII